MESPYMYMDIHPFYGAQASQTHLSRSMDNHILDSYCFTHREKNGSMCPHPGKSHSRTATILLSEFKVEKSGTINFPMKEFGKQLLGKKQPHRNIEATNICFHRKRHSPFFPLYLDQILKVHFKNTAFSFQNKSQT